MTEYNPPICESLGCNMTDALCPAGWYCVNDLCLPELGNCTAPPT
jgi:hypothetical protein